MTAACDLPIDLSTKSRHHHHHAHHHGRHLAVHHRLVQLDHEQLQRLHYEYLSHQQLSAALANHPLNRLYAASHQNQHHRHHLDQLERLEQLHFAAAASAAHEGHPLGHQLLGQHQTNQSSANGNQAQDGSQNGAPATELDNAKSQFMSANLALNINLSSPPSLASNSQQNSSAQLEALSSHQHHLQQSQQLAHHHQHLQQLQLVAAAAAESQHLHLHHHHLTHNNNPNSTIHQHHQHHNLAHLHLGHHHHHHHTNLSQLHHHDLAKLANSASALSTASLASSTLSSASSSSSSSASSVSSSSNEAASPEVQEEGPLDATIGHHHIHLQSAFNAERQLQAGILSHSNHHHHHHESALLQHKAESPPAQQLNQQLSLNQLNGVATGDAGGVNGGGREENPSPIDLHRSATSSTVSTMSSPSSSSASITSNSSSMNLQLNDKKRINRPLTAQVPRLHGSFAPPSLVTDPKELEQSRPDSAMDKMRRTLPPLDRTPGPQAAQLRKVLNVMFPHSYLKLYHRPPHSVCSIFKTKIAKGSEEELDEILEASSEPASRTQILSLQQELQASLAQHQAKPVGLCPIRRAIYDQCFDELIRQVTVGCIEQGLLLFQLRNELRLTTSYYRRAYESAVGYGLRKSHDAELRMEIVREKTAEIERQVAQSGAGHRTGNKAVSLEGEIEQIERIKSYYESELAKKDAIIRQQRGVIKLFGAK